MEKMVKNNEILKFSIEVILQVFKSINKKIDEMKEIGDISGIEILEKDVIPKYEKLYGGLTGEAVEKFDEEQISVIKKYIEDIKDFPEEGIIFRDVTPLLKDKEAYKESIDTFAKWIDGLGVQVDVVAGPEARGFLFGCPVAYKVNAGFVPVRKPGKLPRETVSASYDLEYGKNEVHIHADSIKPGENVVIIDDLLATGGTVEATIQLVEQLGGKVVGIAFLIELEALKGREKLKDYNVYSVLTY